MIRRMVTVFILAAALVCSLYAGARAQESDELKKEIQELRERVDEMEQRSEVTEEEIRKHEDKHLIHGGAAETREIEGLRIGAGITQVLQYATGVDEDLSDEDDFLDASVSADLELEVAVGQTGSIFAGFEAGSGEGVDGILPTLSGFNADAIGDSAVVLLEGWYEDTFFDKVLRARLGKLDVTSDFDTNGAANNETVQFLSPAFVNNLTIDFPLDNSYGGMVWVVPADMVAFGLAVADAEGDGHNINSQTFYMLEADLNLSLAIGNGAYRVYWWKNTRPHAEFKDPADDENDGIGVGISIDQHLGENLVIFGRAGFTDDSIYMVDQYLSVGLELSMAGMGRGKDALAFAYGTARVGDDYEDVFGNHTNERHLEVYYRYQYNDKVAFTPDLQWVDNPGGLGDNGTVTVVGLRTQLSF